MNAARIVRAHALDVSPGNGTRYRLFVIEDPQGGLAWSWVVGTTTLCAGWASDREGGEVRVSIGKCSKVDCAAIVAILDEHLRAGVSRREP